MTVGFVVMIVVSQVQKTCAQNWTNSGVNIYYNSGTVGIGTNAPSVLFDLVSSDTNISTIQHSFYGDVGNARFNFRKARGTIASPTAALNADRMFALNGFAYDGSAFVSGTQIVGDIDGTVSSGVVPGRLVFLTKNTAGSLLERMRIDSAGNVGIGTAAPTSRLHVYGDDNLTSGTYINTMITGSQTTANSSGEYVGFDVNPYYTAAGTLNLMYGSTSYPFNSGSGTVNAMFGHAASPLNLGSGNVGAMMGVVNTPGNYGSGSVGSLYGEYAELQNMGTGTVTNAYSLFIDNPQKASSATIANNYGIYIANQTAATNNYSIYSAGGQNYFAGNVGVGTASPIAHFDVRTGTVALPPGGGLDPNVYRTWLPYADGNNYIRGTTIIADQGGNVGIGVGTPSYKLDVAGRIRSSVDGFMFPDGTVQSTASLGGTITGVTAGDGLTGGGTSGNATVNIGQGIGVTVAAHNISVNYGSGTGTAVEGSKQITITTDASSGLTGGAAVMLGSGPSFTLVNTDKGSSQSIFKNVTSGTTQFSAQLNNDSVRFEGTGGANVSLDVNTKKVIIDASGITSSQWVNGSGNISYASGNVGIGTPSPGSKLDVTGNTNITGDLNVTGHINARYQDVAEWVPTSAQLPTGTVVVLDSTKSNQVISSTHAYDTRVAGVVSEQPGIELGEGGAGKVLVAATGRVRVNVDASRGAIHIGDLLVTSDITGVAMKSEPINLGGVQLHRPGTLIGKALEPLEKGSGKILVLLSLQ